MTRAPVPIAATGLVVAAVAMLGLARTAAASPSAHLVYARSPDASSCPDEGALRNAVAARLGYDPFFPWARRTVVVQVWRERGRYRARLQLVDAEGLAHGTRVLSSDQPGCDELFDAAALAISIAMDSLPKDEPPPVPASPLASAPAPAPTPALATPAAPAPPDTAAPGPAPALHPRFLLGLDVLGVLNTEPALAAALAASAGLRVRALSATIELRADAPASTTNASGPGRVRAWSYQAALAPCFHALGASLCAVGAIGVLSARSSGISDPRSDSGVFATVGPRVGYDWPLSERVSLGARLDAAVDLRRASLQIGEAVAWRAPLIAGSAGLGISANFE